MNPHLLRAAADELGRAGRGGREAIVERYAAAAGVGVNTLRRHLAALAGRPAAAAPPRVPPELATDLEALVRIKKAPPKGTGRELSLRRALRLGIEHGLVGPALGRVAESTIARWIRSLGLGQEDRRVSRWQAARPNEVHQFDASQSSYCRVERVLPDGDVLLTLSPHGPEYKNKPLGPDRLRWWIYALVDDHSGYRLARGAAALGENAPHALDFLRWAWGAKQNGAGPFCGRPEFLLVDCGPLARDGAFADLFLRLGIAVLSGEPGNSQARGKVERPFRDLWQDLELTFFVALEAGGDYRKVQMTGAEYNRRLLAWLAERNELLHRQGAVTKREAWQTIAQHGGPILVPDEAWGTAVRPPLRRWVDREGCVSVRGARFEVPGLAQTHVEILEGVLDDRLVALEISSGRKVECRRARMLAFGEYRGAKAPAGAALRARPPVLRAEAKRLRAGTPGPPRVAAFRPRAQTAPMPPDPRAGALARAANPLEETIARTEAEAPELDRYAVLDLFEAAGVPPAAARAFIWPRLPAAATATGPEAMALMASYREISGVRREAVNE